LRGLFFVQIMMKFEKGYNSRIVLTIISIVFLCSTNLYSYPMSEDSLRLEVGQGDDTYERMSGVANAVFSTERKQKIEETIRPLVERYREVSRRQRKILAGEPTYEEVFFGEILPELKTRYQAYLRGEQEGSPLALLLISGGGGSGKTSVVNWFQGIASQELHDLVQQEGKDVDEGPVRTVSFDSYILQKSDRPIDPVTGKDTQNPYEKFQVGRFVKDMMTLSGGQVIYIPVFDFTTRARLKLIQDRKGNIVILNGSERAVVRIDNNLKEPCIVYAGESAAEAKMNEIPVSVFRNDEGHTVIRIHNTDHVIITGQADETVMIRVDSHERQLSKDEPIEAWERIDPEGKIIIIEGILALSNKKLTQQSLSVFIDAEFWPRLLRMLVRFKGESGRGESKSEFIEKRMTLRLTEEIPYILPTREHAQLLASTQTRSESILAFFLAGIFEKTETFPQEINEVFKDLGIEPSVLSEELQKISLEGIRRLLRKGGVIDYTAGTSFWVFFLEGELVLKSPRREFQSRFKDFILFHDKVLKQRLGGLMVPSSVCDVTDLGITQMVDGEQLHLGNVIIQSRVEPLKERVSRLLSQNQAIHKRIKGFSAKSDVKEIQGLFSAYNRTHEEIKDLIERYFMLQQELWSRGIVDTDPRFMEKYGLMVIHGQEQLVVIGVDGLVDDPSQYDPLIFRRQGIRPTDLPRDFLSYYDSLVEDMVPSRDVFHTEYFETHLQEARPVPDLSDVEISEMQMRYIVELVKKAKISMLRTLFNTLSVRDDQLGRYWVKLYLDTVHPHGTLQYKVVEGVYEQIINDTEILAGQENILDAMLKLVRTAAQDSVLAAAEQYELAEDLIYYTLENKAPVVGSVRHRIDEISDNNLVLFDSNEVSGSLGSFSEIYNAKSKEDIFVVVVKDATQKETLERELRDVGLNPQSDDLKVGILKGPALEDYDVMLRAAEANEVFGNFKIIRGRDIDEKRRNLREAVMQI